jgi:hypothetical protein
MENTIGGQWDGPAIETYALPTGFSKETNIFYDVLEEIDRARLLHPVWPTDTIHATFLMMEEAGEVVQAVNNLIWGHKGGTVADVRKEIIETMAMCLRLLVETPGL